MDKPVSRLRNVEKWYELDDRFTSESDIKKFGNYFLKKFSSSVDVSSNLIFLTGVAVHVNCPESLLNTIVETVSKKLTPLNIVDVNMLTVAEKQDLLVTIMGSVFKEEPIKNVLKYVECDYLPPKILEQLFKNLWSFEYALTSVDILVHFILHKNITRFMAEECAQFLGATENLYNNQTFLKERGSTHFLDEWSQIMDRQKKMFAVWLSWNNNVPADVMRTVYCESGTSWQVVESLSEYSVLDDETLLSLLQHEPSVWKNLTHNPHAPLWVLRVILNGWQENGTDNALICRNLACHDNMTNEMLHNLLNKAANLSAKNSVVQSLFERNSLKEKNWPEEWVEAKYGVKFDTIVQKF